MAPRGRTVAGRALRFGLAVALGLAATSVGARAQESNGARRFYEIARAASTTGAVCEEQGGTVILHRDYVSTKASEGVSVGTYVPTGRQVVCVAFGETVSRGWFTDAVNLGLCCWPTR